jgi:hypothetical protein
VAGAQPRPAPRAGVDESATTESVSPLCAATFRTANFAVCAPTEQDAREFGRLAELERHRRSVDWLGRDMPPWDEPCKLTVDINPKKLSGATYFKFQGGRVVWRQMEIHGSREKLKTCILPHEVTHTVIAYYFGRPSPRWSDEGAAGCSEDAEEREKLEKSAVRVLNAGEGIKLASLFHIQDVPRNNTEIAWVYGQGYSVTYWLSAKLGRPGFLKFVSVGMENGWEAAAQGAGFESVEALEAAWIKYLAAGGQKTIVCRCGPDCVGPACECGCRGTPSADAQPAADTVNWWWLVPATVFALAAASAARSVRRHGAPGGLQYAAV